MSGTAVTARPRKRSRTSEDGDKVAAVSTGKKARGRPRVDTQDATAADRRRTQIRLAQRAYRQRKETTISSLRQQSSQLHAIIDQMNKAFLRFNDLAVQSGLLLMNHELAAELERTNETFSNCSKTASEQILVSDEEDLNETGTTRRAQDPAAPIAAPSVQSSQAIEPQVKEQSWGYAATKHITERPRLRVDARQPQTYFSHISSSSYNLPEPSNNPQLLPRQFTVGEVQDQPSSANRSYQSHLTNEQSQAQQQQQQQEQPLPFGLVDIPSREQSPFVPPYIFPVDIPAMGAELPPAPRHSLKTTTSRPSISTLSTRTLPPAFTYSFDEVTFARRLTRATIEAGFLLLSTSGGPPAAISAKFKLSLPYLTLDEVRDRFKIVLSRGVDEDLDWYSTPFLHLGGAGTHYQRRDAYGKVIPLRNAWTVRQIGPLDKRMIRMENVADGQIQDFEGIDLEGFEGEWFDPHDVQGYLEEQWHCRIDPKSSFAECLIDSETIFPDDETGSPSMSHGSTASSTDFSVSPSVPHAFNASQPSHGLDTLFNNASVPHFLAAPNKQSLPDLSFDQTLGLDLAPSFDMGFAGSSGHGTLGLSVMGETERLAFVRQKPKKLAWVDVSKLIDSIIKQAVCIGRSPGFRRKDIDTAFREALIPAC
ncbi:hypothetical protein EKO04_009871 [Ascochyta lentis]|uniref:BZIP domain-containing protein n=1 Tax=Ascochyta lentis TaxID=205686 RepID=A0A8H7IWF6_9PLEO|nr:hypothetical protein EKO04_009871 [Ascochyta lentis]